MTLQNIETMTSKGERQSGNIKATGVAEIVWHHMLALGALSIEGDCDAMGLKVQWKQGGYTFFLNEQDLCDYIQMCVFDSQCNFDCLPDEMMPTGARPNNCSWCGKNPKDRRILLSNGICPTCFQKITNKL